MGRSAIFSLTAKSRYGLPAVFRLARQTDGELVQVKELAGEEGIPIQYLEQILNRLVKSGLVRAIRGKNGGYRLARPADRTSFLEVLEALEGSLEVARGSKAGTAVHELFRSTEAVIRQTLDIPLSEVLEREAQAEGNYVFQI